MSANIKGLQMNREQMELLERQLKDARERYRDADTFFVTDKGVWVLSTFGKVNASQTRLGDGDSDFEAPDDLSEL